MKTFLKPLSLAEERHYLEQCQKGDPQAKNILIEHNLRLVAHVVKKYQGGGQELDDLISIGTIGLIKAITTFDPSKSPRLSTYAARCIDNAILSQIRELPKTNTPGKQKNRNGKSGAGIRKAGERALTGLLTCFLFY